MMVYEIYGLGSSEKHNINPYIYMKHKPVLHQYHCRHCRTAGPTPNAWERPHCRCASPPDGNHLRAAITVHAHLYLIQSNKINDGGGPFFYDLIIRQQKIAATSKSNIRVTLNCFI
jgi:hypothetical protein